MKIITYLAFTLLSIVFQFVVMDFIQEKVKLDDEISHQSDKIGPKNKRVGFNMTSPKKRFSEILEKYTEKPHALYYRTAGLVEKDAAAKTFSNSSMTESILTTELSSTIFDLLYDENITVSEETFTTESFNSITEFDNVTESTFFGKKNTTEIQPKSTPKKMSKDCGCNLLYKVCDANCCCDSDCTDEERKIFACAESALKEEGSFCYAQLMYNTYLMGSNVDSLFCIVKNNLPEKRKIEQKTHDPTVLAKSFKWHTSNKLRNVQEFKKEPYKYGDPIWLLRNNSIYYMDLPSTSFNNYCNDRRPVKFLKDETIRCNINLSDLEALQILSTPEDTFIISVTEKSANTSTLNCSTLHCTKWNIILCDDAICTNYNKSLHDPLCTENICTDLALKVDYIFHYYDSKIMNATIKFYVQKVSLNLHYKEEINVRFLVANETMDHIVEFSGNPGYISGRPIIASYSEGNYTDDFFNNTVKLKKYILHPENKNGQCVRSNMSNNMALFGTNKRMKCRYSYVPRVQYRNATAICKDIQKNITGLLGLANKTAVSPLGNPYELRDEDWITMTVDTSETLLFGILNKQKTKLHCYNLVSRFSLIFTYVDVSNKTTRRENKLLSASVSVTPQNITFNTDDMSTTVTIDTVFLDETKPSVYEYAGAPQLNLHLPRDFFFPFPSNLACTHILNLRLIIFICIILLHQIK